MSNYNMRLIWVVIPLVLIGIIGMQDSFGTQCAGGTIRIETTKPVSQHIEIGKDVLRISGNLVSVYNQTQNVLLTVDSCNDQPCFQCSASKTFLPDHANEGLHFEKVPHISENIFLKPYEIRPFEINLKPLTSGTYLVQTVALTDKYVNLDGGWTIIVREMSPIKQIKSGISHSKITCNEGLELIFKPSDNAPACVKPATAEKLKERKWLISIVSAEISVEEDIKQSKIIKTWIRGPSIPQCGESFLWENNIHRDMSISKEEFVIIRNFYDKYGVDIINATISTASAQSCEACYCSMGHYEVLSVNFIPEKWHIQPSEFTICTEPSCPFIASSPDGSCKGIIHNEEGNTLKNLDSIKLGLGLATLDKTKCEN